jgi:colicin import membrane protein
VAEKAFFRRAGAEIERALVASRTLELLRNPGLRLYSRPGETREQFAARCDEAAQARADEETAKLRDKLEARGERFRRALAEAQRRQAEAQADADAARQRDLVSGAGAVLGALLGGRRRARDLDALGRALGGGSTGASGAGARARSAAAKAGDAAADLAALEQELAEEVAAITSAWDAKAGEIETVAVRLEAADVHVARTALAWIPGA